MRCKKCGTESRTGRKFCPNCGSALAICCPKCTAENEPLSKFCEDCGAALTAAPLGAGVEGVQQSQTETYAAARVDDTDAALDGERKTVTALFADIKGSMELMEDLDPEEARAIVDPALKLMIDAVHRYDGYIVQSTGDGIFALFGAPVAHEDHPQRALYAGLRMQDEVRRYADSLRAEGRAPLQIRIGVNTGEVVVRSLRTSEARSEYTPIGHTANLAARMQTLANPGSTVIAESTRRLVEGYFTLRPLGASRVKGLAEAINVYEVTGLGPLRTRLQRAAARGLTTFVGREREMEALKHAAEQAQAGHGQIVAVMADPGIGKSRLFYEFKTTSQSGWMVLEAFSVSYGKASAYLPVLELLSAYFEISRDDDERKRRERILGKVLGLDRTLEDTLPYLYTLQSIADAGDSLAQMDPQIRRRRIVEAIKRIVLRESINQPLVVIFEDLHWIDGETQAFLNLLVDSIANARILLLVNYRPEYRHEWGSRTHYTQLRLDPLGRESAEEMLSALLGDEKDLIPLKRLIIERTQGTPFFMEEMVQALFEEGVLQRNGMVTLAGSMSTVKVPGSVQAVLASRIDRLSAPEKELLQTLAVVGREFALKLAQRVTLKSADELEQMLAQLQLSEFIYEQPAVGEVEYSFKHALTQEVAYNSLLSERRRVLHDRTASAIEDLYEPRLDDHYSELAHHYLRGNDTAKAIRYAQLAAEQSVSRGAYAEATNLIETALKLLEKLPERNQHQRAELALREIEGAITFAVYGGASHERERVVKRMCELGEEIGGKEQLASLITLCNFYFQRGEPMQGLEQAQRCLSLAEATRDIDLLAEAYLTAGLLAASCGKFRQAVSHYEDCLRIVRKDHVSSVGLLSEISIPAALANSLHLLGRLGEALKVVGQTLRQARESKRLHDLAFALTVTGEMVRSYRREPEIALAQAEEVIAISEENGFIYWLQRGRFNYGWALAELGQPDEGIAEMERGLAGFRQIGGVPFRQYANALLAHTYARTGRPEEGLTMMNEALEHAERTGEMFNGAEMLRLKGEMLLMPDGRAAEQAEACFRAALEVARAQESRWWELRASVSLARLLCDTGRADEARTVLAEIYNWFTEGFDLPDLKDAKALLEDLGA